MEIKPTNNPSTETCGCCGSNMVWIRGRYPKTDRRLVCATCLAERMDQIREVSHPDYGKAYQNELLKPLKIK